MSEWKGPWKCEKCGRVFRHTEDRRDAKRAGGHVGLPSGQFCKGILKPYDRRAPDPLLGLLREARDALKDFGRHNQGCSGDFPQHKCKCGWERDAVPLLARLDAYLSQAGEQGREP